jgi:SAM-dependent methyltransferase
VNDDVVRRWDEEAAEFDDEPDHGLAEPDIRAAWRSLLLWVLPPTPARVADLGCGTASWALLLAEAGYAVNGVDFSPEMVRAARAKVFGRPEVTITEGDAGTPPLSPGAYDAVLCRHVLWALPEPVAALRRWVDLLRPGGRLVLVEGSWSTGAGLRASETLALLTEVGRSGVVRHLTEAAYWGREITDERYLVVA